MLTQKQHDLLVFIKNRSNEDGVCPSYDELSDAMGLKSRSAIHATIGRLVERGYVERIPHRRRALRVIRMPGAGELERPVTDDMLEGMRRIIRVGLDKPYGITEIAAQMAHYNKLILKRQQEEKLNAPDAS